jgi:hypothetical protein
MRKKEPQWIQVRIKAEDRKLYSRLLKAAKHSSITAIVWLGVALALDDLERKK